MLAVEEFWVFLSFHGRDVSVYMSDERKKADALITELEGHGLHCEAGMKGIPGENLPRLVYWEKQHR